MNAPEPDVNSNSADWQRLSPLEKNARTKAVQELLEPISKLLGKVKPGNDILDLREIKRILGANGVDAIPIVAALDTLPHDERLKLVISAFGERRLSAEVALTALARDQRFVAGITRFQAVLSFKNELANKPTQAPENARREIAAEGPSESSGREKGGSDRDISPRRLEGRSADADWLHLSKEQRNARKNATQQLLQPVLERVSEAGGEPTFNVINSALKDFDAVPVVAALSTLPAEQRLEVLKAFGQRRDMIEAALNKRAFDQRQGKTAAREQAVDSFLQTIGQDKRQTQQNLQQPPDRAQNPIPSHPDQSPVPPNAQTLVPPNPARPNPGPSHPSHGTVASEPAQTSPGIVDSEDGEKNNKARPKHRKSELAKGILAALSQWRLAVLSFFALVLVAPPVAFFALAAALILKAISRIIAAVNKIRDLVWDYREAKAAEKNPGNKGLSNAEKGKSQGNGQQVEQLDGKQTRAYEMFNKVHALFEQNTAQFENDSISHDGIKRLGVSFTNNGISADRLFEKLTRLPEEKARITLRKAGFGTPEQQACLRKALDSLTALSPEHKELATRLESIVGDSRGKQVAARINTFISKLEAMKTTNPGDVEQLFTAVSDLSASDRRKVLFRAGFTDKMSRNAFLYTLAAAAKKKDQDVKVEVFKNKQKEQALNNARPVSLGR